MRTSGDGSSTTQHEVETWRAIRNALARSLHDRSIQLAPMDVALVTRFTMEELEAKGYRLVPVKPTRRMVEASMRALDKTKRTDVRWVASRTKHRWRLVASIEAAPNWRAGYEGEKDG